MHELQQWLTTNPRDYARGVYLYELYGPYKSVLALLKKGETDLTRTKLNEVLREVWDDLQAKKPATQPTINLPGYQKVVIHPGNPAAPPTPLKGEQTAGISAQTKQRRSGVYDEVSNMIDKKWRPLYTEMAMLHARLAMCTTDQQRYHMAGQILKLDQQIREIWYQRDVYNATGKLPATKTRKVVNTAHLTSNQHRQLTNLRTYISRMERSVLPGLVKKQAEKPTKRRAKRIEENNAKLAEWKTQLQQLENA